jgi:hypothetical protein
LAGRKFLFLFLFVKGLPENIVWEKLSSGHHGMETFGPGRWTFSFFFLFGRLSQENI